MTFKVLSLLNKRIQTEEQLKHQERAFPDRNAVIKRRLLQLLDWVPTLVDTHLIPEGFMQNTRDTAGVFSITSSHSQKAFFLFPPPRPLDCYCGVYAEVNLVYKHTQPVIHVAIKASGACHRGNLWLGPEHSLKIVECCGGEMQRVPVLNASKDLQRAGHLFLK